jgi:hypothetical protein
MKIIAKRFLLTGLLLLFWTQVFAEGPDICPCGEDKGNGSDPPPPPGQCLPCPIPIDESVMVLVVVALVFGLYIVHKNNLKAKNPI